MYGRLSAPFHPAGPVIVRPAGNCTPTLPNVVLDVTPNAFVIVELFVEVFSIAVRFKVTFVALLEVEMFAAGLVETSTIWVWFAETFVLEFTKDEVPEESTKKPLAVEFPMFPAKSVQPTYQVYEPFSTVAFVNAVKVLFFVDAFVWLRTEFMYSEQLVVLALLSVVVKLNTKLLELVCRLSTGPLRVTTGAVASTVNWLAAIELFVFPAESVQLTFHVCMPFARGAVVVVKVLLLAAIED